jgi:DNA-directed RNA polymerase subunit omega
MDRTINISYDNIENRFLFVILAAKRALQLQRGARPRHEIGTKKPTVISMAEVLSDKVEYDLPQKKEKRLSR